MKKFINRTKELKFLNNEYKKDSSSLVVIYGRRRIGKTSLIRKFIEDKKHIYFLATEESEKENANSFKSLLQDKIDNILLNNDINLDFTTLFKIVKEENKKEKLIIVIDEFQYLGKSNTAFPSIFQKIWDNELKDENIMVILCGSLIGIMEEQALSYNSPLYGRRTGQLKMKQINFLHYHEFFENKKFDDLVYLYSVTGGVPKYIELFNLDENFFESIKNSILQKESFLYEEPSFLLEKEVSEIGTYFSIIKTIAGGNHKLSKISTVLGVNGSSLTKYLSTLINLDILIRKVPITEENPEKSKKGLYYINDNFLEFWFKFVYPYRSYIEMGAEETVLNKIRENIVENHISYVYEDICSNLLLNMSINEELPFNVLKVGKWWDNKEEIDIVGINNIDNIIVFAECKYTEKVISTDLYNKLREKSNKVIWKNTTRNEYFMLFSKEGFSNELIEISKKNSNLILIHKNKIV